MSKKSLLETALTEADVNWKVVNGEQRELIKQLTLMNKAIQAQDAASAAMICSSLVSVASRAASVITGDPSIHQDGAKTGKKIF